MNNFANTNGAIQVPTRLLGTPLLISQNEADLILAALHNTPSPEMLFSLFESERSKTFDVVNGVAVLPVLGGLTYRGYGWYWRSTYGMIRAQFRDALADPDVKAILLDIDSPGGEAAGVFDLVDEMYAARGQKPVYAVANEHAYSAAYAIGSAADKFFLPRTGGAGSIGVIAIHYEQSKAEADVGVKYSAIYYGARKNDFSIHEPLSKEARDVAQASVNRTGELFVSTVARNRNLSADTIRDQQAAIYIGQDAVDAGLADGLKNFNEVLTELSQTNTNTKQGGYRMDIAKIKTDLAAALTNIETKQAAMAMLSEMGFSSVDQSAVDSAAKETEEKIAAARVEGANDERVRCKSIAEKCALAGNPLMAPQLIGEKVSVEDAATRILEANHNGSPANGLDNANGGLPAGGADYLIADAKRRAGKA